MSILINLEYILEPRGTKFWRAIIREMDPSLTAEFPILSIAVFDFLLLTLLKYKVLVPLRV